MQKPKGGKMNEIIATPKVSVGFRIALPEEVRTGIDAKIGDKVAIVRNDAGEYVIKNRAAGA